MKLAPLGVFYIYVLRKLYNLGKKKPPPKKRFAPWV
jgi:hypothetical protein